MADLVAAPDIQNCKRITEFKRDSVERRHHKRIDGRSTDAHIMAMRRFYESVADLL